MRGGEGVREGGHTEIEVVNMSQNVLYVKVWKNNICVCECVCVCEGVGVCTVQCACLCLQNMINSVYILGMVPGRHCLEMPCQVQPYQARAC